MNLFWILLMAHQKKSLLYFSTFLSQMRKGFWQMYALYLCIFLRVCNNEVAFAWLVTMIKSCSEKINILSYPKNTLNFIMKFTGEGLICLGSFWHGWMHCFVFFLFIHLPWTRQMMLWCFLSPLQRIPFCWPMQYFPQHFPTSSNGFQNFHRQ